MNHPAACQLYSVYRAEACNNTFLLCDGLKQSQIEQIDLRLLHARLIEENRDDILILLDGQSENGHLSARFLVLGCDGEFGEFCGNGARALAGYLYANYPEFDQFTLRTSKGIYPLKKLDGGKYAAVLPHPCTKWNPQFISDWTRFQKEYPDFFYVEAIEPHLTIQQKMGDEELFALGRELNGKKDLFPLGINLNAWEQIGPQALYVKTYERGVQRLTRSCGTGSISSTMHAQLKGEISVETPGGALQIIWTPHGVEIGGETTFEKLPI